MSRPAQQSAMIPSMATAGTELIPSFFAYSATVSSFISRTITSHESHAHSLILAIALSQMEQPALEHFHFSVLTHYKSPKLQSVFAPQQTMPCSSSAFVWADKRLIQRCRKYNNRRLPDAVSCHSPYSCRKSNRSRPASLRFVRAHSSI